MSALKRTDEQQEIVDTVAAESDTVIEAGAGCLAADTILNVNRGGNGAQRSIEYVVRQLVGAPVMRRTLNGKDIVQRARQWDLEIPTQLARADGAVSRLGEMERAWFSGVKRTWEVRTETGRTIRATAEHPFLVRGGTWAKLEELDVGHELHVNVGRSAREKAPKLMYRAVGTRYHPNQVSRSNERVKFSVPLHRAIIEAEINGLSLEQFVEILRRDPIAAAGLHYLGREWHVHHVDHNTLNNERSNLELMTQEEHHRLHAHEGAKNNVLWQIGSEHVIAIRSYGEEPTYDVAMVDEPHNFLANGFVVHNTGKSTTLTMVGANEGQRGRNGIVIYFNRAPADEAKRTMPRNILATTAHSLALSAMKNEPCVQRLNGPRVTAKGLAEDFLGLTKWFPVPNRKPISTWKMASMAERAVTRFCYSDATEIEPWHVERIEGIPDDVMHQLRAEVLPFAVEIWQDLQRGHGFAEFKHDHYMKMWALQDPKLSADFLFVDESQDTNGVLAGIVRRQDHLQRVMVGDSQQRLFAWRGTVDIMKEFGAKAEVRYLTQSFRFGDAVAEEANRWLEYLESPLRLRGLPSLPSRLEPLEAPDVILCRTNADVIAQAMGNQYEGRKVSIVGSPSPASDIVSFVDAVAQLKQTGKTSHRELSAFRTWADVQAYVHDEQPGGNIATFVRLIERYGTDLLRKVADECVSPFQSDVSISTVHKIKGMEWPRVQLDGNIAPDPAVDQNAPGGSTGELMVAYVAATRAQEVLDATSFEGFHRWRRRKREIEKSLLMAAQSNTTP